MKKNFPLKEMLDFFLVQDTVLDRVQDVVGLRKWSPIFIFCKRPENVMFDGEIVKKKFPLQEILDLDNFWSKTESKTKS